MALTRQSRRQTQSTRFDDTDDTCCAQSPTTSLTSARHQLRVGAAATSTPLAAVSGADAASNHRLYIQHLSPIRNATSSRNKNVVILSAQRATRKFHAQMDASRRQESLVSSHDLSWSDTTIDHSPHKGTYSSGYSSGGDAWPSVAGVLETPERRRLRAAAPQPPCLAHFPNNAISTVFSSPPLQQTTLSMKSESPQLLRTPKASHGAFLAASVHISSSPMGAFFYRRSGAGGGVLSSNENVMSSPLSHKKFVGIRFSGSQISRPTEACLLSTERAPTMSADAFVDYAAENDAVTAAPILFGTTTTTTASDESSHLSEDSGISTFFLSTAGSTISPNCSRDQTGPGRSFTSEFAIPPSTSGASALTGLPSNTMHIETPSKGLTTETDDCLLALCDTSRLFALHTTPVKPLPLQSASPAVALHGFAPEVASGPLEAGIFTALQRHRSAVRFSPRKCVGRLRRRGILRRPTGSRSPRAAGYRQLIVFEELDSQDLLSLEQLERFQGIRAELVAVNEFFVANRARLVGESLDQVEVTALARLFFRNNRAKFATVAAPLFQQLTLELPSASRYCTLSAGPPDGRVAVILDSEWT